MPSQETKERSAASCDHCRQHKTKCIRHESGSCRRCLRAGRECVTGNARVGRPYYQSSKEQYDLMASVVRHFLPNTSLNKESLRDVVQQLSDSNSAENNTATGNNGPSLSNAGHAAQSSEIVQSSSNTLGVPLNTMILSAEAQEASASSTVGRRPSQNAVFQSPSQAHPQIIYPLPPGTVAQLDEYGHNPTPPRYPDDAIPNSERSPSHHSGISHSSETFPIESIARKDDRDITRYDSGTSWPAFFSKLQATVGPQYNSLVRNPPFVLDEGGTRTPVEMVLPDNLPSRSEFEKASLKFFAEVNCVNYILSYQQLQSHMICALDQKAQLTHSVFMLLCLILSFDEKYDHYFSKACEHVHYVLEEGTVASVEALMLMALCRMNRGQKNLAWISIGCASRIAQSLGLHLSEDCWEEKSQVVIEDRKRLWWSLYDLEICLAYRLGRCPGINLSSCRVGMPSETVFNLLPNSPPDYHRAVSQLSIINGLIVQDLYGPKSAQICMDSRADELINDVEHFWEEVPPHLKPNTHLAPSHCRAVLYLGLRYNYTILLATRPSIVSCWKDPGSCSPGLMKRVETSEAANKRSLKLLKSMVEANVLSHKSYLDTSYILANMMMFILRMVKDPSLELLNEASEYRTILEGTRHLTIGKALVTAFEATMDDVKTILSSKEQLQQPDYMFIDDFLQEFMGADETMWPTWPTDRVLNGL